MNPPLRIPIPAPVPPAMAPVLRLAAALALALGLAAGAASADTAPDSTRIKDRLRPGAWEFTFGGSFSNYSGVNSGSAEVRAGTFFPGGRGLLGVETLLAYTLADDLNILDAQAGLTWQRPINFQLVSRDPGSLWPYAGIFGGVSQAWDGPFEDTRYPVGFNLGLRIVHDRSNAVRIEYRWRRLLDTSPEYAPFADYEDTQSGWFVGVSFLSSNTPR